MVVAGFGADLILLNCFDLEEMRIIGLEDEPNKIEKLKELTGKPVGVNLEPIDLAAELETEMVFISSGRSGSIDNFKRAESLVVDFICLTRNSGTGVSNKEISLAISEAKKYFSGIIMAGKMHSAGVFEKIITDDVIEDFVQAGADVETIRQLALTSKRAGADIQHIGDAGFNGTADPENIMALSIAIRGKRHIYLKMTQSVNR